MKQFIKTMCVLTLLVSLAFSANRRVLKSDMKMDKMIKAEPDYRRGPGATREDCPIIGPNNQDAFITLIDPSSTASLVKR